MLIRDEFQPESQLIRVTLDLSYTVTAESSLLGVIYRLSHGKQLEAGCLMASLSECGEQIK